MNHRPTTDITNRTDGSAISLLVSFNEEVKTPAGRIEPDGTGFLLHRENSKPRRFATASGAVEVLRRLSP